MGKGLFEECVSGDILSGSGERVYVLYSVGSEQYGIAVEFVRRIVEKTELTPESGMEPRIAGTLQYNGCKVPVMDIRTLLKVPGVYEGRGIIIIIEMEKRFYGLLVDFICGFDVVPDFMTSGIDDMLN